jgi:hypothetical protein
MTRLRLFARITLALVPVAAAVVLVAESNSSTIKFHDDCDPKTFTAAGILCIGHGETKLNELLAEVKEEGSADDWEFTPDQSTAKIGAAVKLQNRGGEIHTFTKVAAFGGGFISILNGKKTPAPECIAAPNLPDVPHAGLLFVAPATTVPGPIAGGPDLPAGTRTKFQCCIHPWMHTEITAK